jgi:hypothetical protein
LLKLSLLGRIRFQFSKFHVSAEFLGVYGIYTVEPILYKNGTNGTTPNSLGNGPFLRWAGAPIDFRREDSHSNDHCLLLRDQEGDIVGFIEHVFFLGRGFFTAIWLGGPESIEIIVRHEYNFG